MQSLTRENGYIFRITHVGNLRWIFTHGLHCRASEVLDPHFVEIGNPEVIDRRAARAVTSGPCGVLDDYIPFYFTPLTPMLYNIRTGFQVQQQEMRDIAIIVAKINVIRERKYRVVVADRNAALDTVSFSEADEELDSLPWDYWRARDFRRDPETPDKLERYMAEALVHKILGIDAVSGVVLYDDQTKTEVELWASEAGADLACKSNAKWFFS